MNTKIKSLNKETLVNELSLSTNFSKETLLNYDLNQLVKIKDLNVQKIEVVTTVKSSNDIATEVLKELESNNNKLTAFQVGEIIASDMSTNQKSWFGLPYSTVKQQFDGYTLDTALGINNAFDIAKLEKMQKRVNARINSHIVHVGKTTNKTINSILIEAKRPLVCEMLTQNDIKYIVLSDVK